MKVTKHTDGSTTITMEDEQITVEVGEPGIGGDVVISRGERHGRRGRFRVVESVCVARGTIQSIIEALSRAYLVALLVCFALHGCADGNPKIVRVDTIDAAVAPDAFVFEDAPPDACTFHRDVDAGPDDCCRFAPDQAAIAACAVPTLTPGTCGVFACELADCTFVTVHACRPSE